MADRRLMATTSRTVGSGDQTPHIPHAARRQISLRYWYWSLSRVTFDILWIAKKKTKTESERRTISWNSWTPEVIGRPPPIELLSSSSQTSPPARKGVPS